MKTKTCLLTLILLGVLCLSLTMHQTAQAQDTVTYLLSNINDLRASLGVAPYGLNGTLSVAAQNHASWMAQTGQVSHTQPDGSTPSSRAQAAGYQSSWVSENIYMGTNATAQSAWQWWLNSPVHYRGITSANYSEVGIASATGPYGQAFVLVFGNPSGVWTPPVSNSAGGNGNDSGAVPGLPPYVVGLDNFGNIMHEIQPGHTLGDIALIYGYTWDDLQYIRDLNGMTEEEGRNLEIGSILLVPPQAGTYTPTPVPADYTAPAPLSIEELQRVDNPGAPTATLDFPVITILPPTETPSPTATIAGLVVTSAVVPEWAVATEGTAEVETLVEVALNYTPDPNASPTPAWQAMTVTPASTSVAMVSSDPNTIGGLIEPAVVEVTLENDHEGDSDGASPLLYGAIALQSLIILGAGIAFWRQNRK